MKKALAIIIAVILIIVIAIFVRNRVAESKVGYEIANVDVYEYVKFKENNKYGVINRDGTKIIDAKYNNIQIPNPSKDIFICSKEDGSVEVLNSKNSKLFDKYEEVQPVQLKNIASTLCYEKSTLIYKKDGLYGLINFEGKELTKNIYSKIENLLGTEGKLLVSKDGKCGVININGNILVNTRYDNIYTDEYIDKETKYEKAGFIVSNTEQDGYKYGYIDYKGNTLLDTKYNKIARFTDKEDIYLVVTQNGQEGVYKGSSQIIKPEYQGIELTENGVFVLQKNQKMGLASIDGKIFTEFEYTMVEEKGMYIYAEKPTGNAVYNSKGEKVDISFSKAIYETENENYRIVTSINNDVTYYGIEGKDGNTLVDANYAYIEYVYGDFFIAEDLNEKYGVITQNGKTIVPFSYDLIQKIKDKNILQASYTELKDVEFFSKLLNKISTTSSANVENNNSYIKIYNDTKEEYFDVDGNKINKDSEIVKNEQKANLPNNIGDYKKVQYSLTDVYYEK